MLKAINESYQQGLVPDDYHLAELNSRLKKGLKQSDVRDAQLDILLTDALLRLGYHLIFGKVFPGNLDADWNLRRDFLSKDPVAKINYILQSDNRLKKFLKQNINLGPFYQGLIKALAQYRQIQQAGGWQSVPSGTTIKPGMTDTRIAQIKARLYATGDLEKETIDPEAHIYDESTEAGIKHFQQRHNLEVDGVIGKGTLEAMNIPVAQRIDQIRANLERIRWVKQNLDEEFVLVNIAGFKVYYVKDNKLVWKSRAQVGKEYRKTPVFRDDIKYLVFNPTWTVSPTILRKDVLPKI
ncbi:MAG: peptidoglycan-binding protein [gamma proteobacterium symbiont of Lucinoma myriamae]|nr:peptidoglycan-binding protein [gamma proteobacterium symbiont of Lucinoma myriamae]MCU7818080.1 peptidoglycan-binding protein [gamma proteobacterium symbiont of Lucinoma myriamae]MCU7832424.1 peptidoglycan-binding protein [gamma proteobacterium symbiont of Lucinoma myriamae]